MVYRGESHITPDVQVVFCVDMVEKGGGVPRPRRSAATWTPVGGARVCQGKKEVGPAYYQHFHLFTGADPGDES